MCNDRFSNHNRCCRNEWFDSEALREESLLFDRDAEDFAAQRQFEGCGWQRSSGCCWSGRNNWCCWNRFGMDEV